MKILVVCQYYKPEPFRISDICEALAAQGHAVTVVTGTPNYPEGEIYPGYEGTSHRDEIINGVRVHRCPIHPRKRGALHRFWNYYSFVFASKRYLSRLEEDFDVVLVNQLSPVMMAEGALDWAKRHGKKTVLYCLDLWPESLSAGGIRPGSLIYRVFWYISRRIYRGADAIAVTSQGFEDYFRTALKLPDAKLEYLPQYAEELFDRLPEAPPHPGVFNAVFAGNIGEMQTVETIMEAAGKLTSRPDIHFHIVGDGIRLDACRQLAEGLSNVTFYGRRDVSEMPGFYALADVMLVTLKADPVLSLTLPGKVQSYFAAGKPVAGAINGETAAVVADADCGVCVAAEDANALAEALVSLASTPERLGEYGANARRYYEAHFQKDAFLRTLTDVLKENC